jgi:hypothetical protein
VSTPSHDNASEVERIMGEIEHRVRSRLRQDLLERGGDPSFADQELFEAVERVLRRGVQQSERPAALLVAELLAAEGEWRFEPAIRWSSHRPFIGRAVVFLKRRVLMPVVRWLFEYSRENFRRQERINLVLFSCLEQLAVEHARVRRDLARLATSPAADPPADQPRR